MKDDKIQIYKQNKMTEKQICVAIKTDGHRCGLKATNGKERCSRHNTSLINDGPHTTARKELTNKHKRSIKELNEQWSERILTEQNQILKRDLMNDRIFELNTLNNNNKHEFDLLCRRQREEIERTGVDPDAEANQRKREEAIARETARLHEIELLEQQMILNDIQRQQNGAIGAGAGGQVQNDNRLAAFAAHEQNVHDKLAIDMMKKSIEKLLTIEVPEEFRWNTRKCSKTPGDIIIQCDLTPKGAWQMSAKYCQDENICNMGVGIYGRVLDSVWQFILSSEHKQDLLKVLKQEMEDNIGMCAAGNLTRICNILAGYIDGIGSNESTAEIVGRLMGKLMEIESVEQRLSEAYKILKENNVPSSQWMEWVEALVSDQDTTYNIGFIKNNENQVTGFIAVSI